MDKMPSRPTKRLKTDHEPALSPSTDAGSSPPDMDEIPFRSVLVTGRSSKNMRHIRSQYNEFLDSTVEYTILYEEKSKRMALWEGLTVYKRFRLQDDADNPIDCKVGDIVYVKCEDESQDNEDGGNHTINAPIKSWVGQVLEIRAHDKCHVFLRVWWLNRPEDTEGGRQPYHGEDEVIPTNQMDIIDANTVNSKVEGLKRIDEFADDDAVPMQEVELIWRQTYDIRDGSFSPLRRYCICKKFKHPNLPLLACENKTCGAWLHTNCIKDDAAKRYYAWASHGEKKGESTATNSEGKQNSMMNSIMSRFGLSPSRQPGPEQIDVDLERLALISSEKAWKRYTVSIENLSSQKNVPVELKITDLKTSSTIVEPVRCLECRAVIK